MELYRTQEVWPLTQQMEIMAIITSATAKNSKRHNSSLSNKTQRTSIITAQANILAPRFTHTQHSTDTIFSIQNQFVHAGHLTKY